MGGCGGCGDGSGGGGGCGRVRVTHGRRGYIGAFQYAQTDNVVPVFDERTVARITCFKCNQQGHFDEFCLELVEGEQMHINAVEIDEL